MAIIPIWAESYRPNSSDGYVFQHEEQKQQIESWIKDKSIPHLLLSGSPGTGKTTLAKLLISSIGIHEYDILEANGSKEARKIEWIDKLIGFCSTMPFGEFKVVLIDEADYMNPASVQPALRNLMQEYNTTVRFILTCNYPGRILPAIHSRCTKFHIDKLDVIEFTARAAKILLTEGIDFELDTLDSYVKSSYPDLRKCLNSLQTYSTTGSLIMPKSAESGSDDYKFAVVKLFKDGKIREARKLVCSQVGAEQMEEFFKFAYDNLNLWSDTEEGQDEAILIIRKGLINNVLCADSEINLSATMTELSQIGV